MALQIKLFVFIKWIDGEEGGEEAEPGRREEEIKFQFSHKMACLKTSQQPRSPVDFEFPTNSPILS